MTEKELHRLKRREVLQLLLAQSEELAEVRAQLEQVTGERDQLAETYERLRKRLDQKDAHIHGLRELLEKERTKRRIELTEAGNIAEAALRLNGIFESAQAAADQYLENIRLLSENGGVLPEESRDLERLEEAYRKDAEEDGGSEDEGPADLQMDDWNQDIRPLEGTGSGTSSGEASYDRAEPPARTDGGPNEAEGQGT